MQLSQRRLNAYRNLGALLLQTARLKVYQLVGKREDLGMNTFVPHDEADLENLWILVPRDEIV